MPGNWQGPWVTGFELENWPSYQQQRKQRPQRVNDPTETSEAYGPGPQWALQSILVEPPTRKGVAVHRLWKLWPVVRDREGLI